MESDKSVPHQNIHLGTPQLTMLTLLYYSVPVFAGKDDKEEITEEIMTKKAVIITDTVH